MLGTERIPLKRIKSLGEINPPIDFFFFLWRNRIFTPKFQLQEDFELLAWTWWRWVCKASLQVFHWLKYRFFCAGWFLFIWAVLPDSDNYHGDTHVPLPNLHSKYANLVHSAHLFLDLMVLLYNCIIILQGTHSTGWFHSKPESKTLFVVTCLWMNQWH